jgi:hypothetical protein
MFFDHKVGVWLLKNVSLFLETEEECIFMQILAFLPTIQKVFSKNMYWNIVRHVCFVWPEKIGVSRGASQNQQLTASFLNKSNLKNVRNKQGKQDKNKKVWFAALQNEAATAFGAFSECRPWRAPAALCCRPEPVRKVRTREQIEKRTSLQGLDPSHTASLPDHVGVELIRIVRKLALFVRRPT